MNPERMKKFMAHNGRFVDAMKKASLEIIVRYFTENRCLSPLYCFVLELILDKQALDAVLVETTLDRSHSRPLFSVKAFEFLNGKMEFNFCKESKTSDSLSISQAEWCDLKKKIRNATTSYIQWDNGISKGIHDVGALNEIFQSYREGLLSIESSLTRIGRMIRALKDQPQFIKKAPYHLQNTSFSQERGPPHGVSLSLNR